MEKCSSCLETNRWLTQTTRRIEEINACTVEYVQTIQKLLHELNESHAKYVESNVDTDKNDGEGDNDDSDSDEADTDSSSGQKNTYFCPDLGCRQRKADASFKEYSRHYKTHVTCTVPCAGCRTTLLRVSTLKRHFSDCTELKTKRIIVEHTEAIKQMKAQMDIESKRASHEARRALQGRKRCHQLESNNSKPRKKSRSEKCSRALFPISQTFASSHVVDHNHNEFRSTDATEHQTQMHISSGLSSAPGVIPNTISEPSYLIDSRRISQNNATIGKGASEITNETIGRAAMYFANSQHSTVPSTDAATRSGFFETTNESAMCSHNEPPAAHNHSSAANVLNTYIANNQHSAANSTAQAIRGSSFMSYTMDGSFMYPDDQYPISQGAMTTKRGSSFISNTMDGSFMYPDDPTRTAQNIAIERLESWRST